MSDSWYHLEDLAETVLSYSKFDAYSLFKTDCSNKPFLIQLVYLNRFFSAIIL